MKINVQAEVFKLLNEGWYTPYQMQFLIRERTGHLASESSVSARIRDCRKDFMGSNQVERRPAGKGQTSFEYRIHPDGLRARGEERAA